MCCESLLSPRAEALYRVVILIIQAEVILCRVSNHASHRRLTASSLRTTDSSKNAAYPGLERWEAAARWMVCVQISWRRIRRSEYRAATYVHNASRGTRSTRRWRKDRFCPRQTCSGAVPGTASRARAPSTRQALARSLGPRYGQPWPLHGRCYRAC